MVSMVPWHNYSIVHSLGSLLGDMEGAAWPQQHPSLPWHPPNTQACWGKVPSLPTFHLLCSFWIIMSGCRDRGRVWVAGPRAPNPPMHSFSVPSVFLGTGPTVYFWSRQSEHSSPPRAQIIRKDAEEKEISQLAGSTGLGWDSLYCQQTPALKRRPRMVDCWQDKACFVLHAVSSLHFHPVPFLTGASDTCGRSPSSFSWLPTTWHMEAPPTTLCPRVSPGAAPTLPSDCPPTLSSQWCCTTSSSSSFIFQEPFCPGLHSTSVFCLPLCISPLLLTLPDRFMQETLETKVQQPQSSDQGPSAVLCTSTHLGPKRGGKVTWRWQVYSVCSGHLLGWEVIIWEGAAPWMACGSSWGHITEMLKGAVCTHSSCHGHWCTHVNEWKHLAEPWDWRARLAWTLDPNLGVFSGPKALALHVHSTLSSRNAKTMFFGWDLPWLDMAMKLTGYTVFKSLEPAPHLVLTSRGTITYHRHALYGLWWGLAPKGFRWILVCSGISRLEWHSMCPPEDIWNGHGIPRNTWLQPPAALNVYMYISAGDKDLTLLTCQHCP